MLDDHAVKVTVQGRRGGKFDLDVPDWLDDRDLLAVVLDEGLSPVWKDVWLTSYYEEHLNDRRETRSERRVFLDGLSYEGQIFQAADEVERQVLSKIRAEDLLACLTDQQREWVILCILQGVPYLEVARKQRKNESTVRRGVQSALKRMRNYLHTTAE